MKKLLILILISFTTANATVLEQISDTEANFCTQSGEYEYLAKQLVDEWNAHPDLSIDEVNCNNLFSGQIPTNSEYVSGKQYYVYDSWYISSLNYTCGKKLYVRMKQHKECTYQCANECPEGQSQHPDTCACYEPCSYNCQELRVQAQQECDSQNSLLINYECDNELCLLQYECRALQTLEQGSYGSANFSGSSEKCLLGTDTTGSGYSYTESSSANCYAQIGSTTGNTVIDRAYFDGATCYLEKRALKTCSYGMVDENCECSNNKKCSLDCTEALIKAEADCANSNGLANISCSEELCQISNEGCSLCADGEAVQFNNNLNAYECVADAIADSSSDENHTVSNTEQNNPQPQDENTSAWLSLVNESINNQSKDIVKGFNKSSKTLTEIKEQSKKINSTLTQMKNTQIGSSRRLDNVARKQETTNSRLLEILGQSKKTNELLTNQQSETNSAQIASEIDRVLSAQSTSDQKSDTNFDNLGNKVDSMGQNLSKEISDLAESIMPANGLEKEIDTNISAGFLDDLLEQSDPIGLNALTDIFNQFTTAYDNLHLQISDVIEQFASVKNSVEKGFNIKNLPSAVVTSCVLQKTLEFGELSWKVDMDFCKITSANYSMFYFMFYIMFFITFLKMTISLFMRLL